MSASLPVPDALLDAIADRVAARLVQHAGPSPWLNVTQAAAYIAAPRSRVHDLVARGKLRPHRDGRRLLFRAADLDAALEPPAEPP